MAFQQELDLYLQGLNAQVAEMQSTDQRRQQEMEAMQQQLQAAQQALGR